MRISGTPSELFVGTIVLWLIIWRSVLRRADRVPLAKARFPLSSGGEVTYKGTTHKHFNTLGQRFTSWEAAHEYAGQLADAQRQALEMVPK